MFDFLKKRKVGQEIIVKITGMHCSSCALSIDNALEDLPGVLESSTNYAKGEAKVRINEKADVSQISREITGLGYEVLE